MNRNIKRAATVGMVAAALVTSLGAVPAVSAVVAPVMGDVKIVEFGWNAPGKDVMGNRNAEFVRVKNTTAETVNVENWVLHDSYQNSAGDWGNRFTFKGSALPDGSPFKAVDGSFQIPAAGEVYVYQGSGVDTTPTSATASVYRNGGHIYNNAGDAIYLRTSAESGAFIARVIYTPYRVKVTQ